MSRKCLFKGAQDTSFVHEIIVKLKGRILVIIKGEIKLLVLKLFCGVYMCTIRQIEKKVREKSRDCHNYKPQPFPDPKRKRKPTNLNKHKPNKRTKSPKISSVFPKRGNRNTKRAEKQKNKMTHGMTYNKSSRRINHKATKSKTNTGTYSCLAKL